MTDDPEVIWDNGPWFFRAYRYSAPIEFRDATLWEVIGAATYSVDHEKSAPYALGYGTEILVRDDEPQFVGMFGFWNFLRMVEAETDAFEEEMG